jgi:hypothetical protein
MIIFFNSNKPFNTENLDVYEIQCPDNFQEILSKFLLK